MTSVRKTSSQGDPDQPPRLPLRWAVIIGTAGALAAVTVTAEAGVPVAVIIFFAAAGGLHAMLG